MHVWSTLYKFYEGSFHPRLCRSICGHSFSANAIKSTFRTPNSLNKCPATGCTKSFRLVDCKPNKDLAKKVKAHRRRMERERELELNDVEEVVDWEAPASESHQWSLSDSAFVKQVSARLLDWPGVSVWRYNYRFVQVVHIVSHLWTSSDRVPYVVYSMIQCPGTFWSHHVLVLHWGCVPLRCGTAPPAWVFMDIGSSFGIHDCMLHGPLEFIATSICYGVETSNVLSSSQFWEAVEAWHTMSLRPVASLLKNSFRLLFCTYEFPVL